MAVLSAAFSTVRAFMLAQASSSEARLARQRAVQGWVGAVLVVVVTWVVRVRLPVGGGDAGRPGSVSIPWRTVGLVAASVAAAVAVVVVLAGLVRAQRRRRDREHKEQQARWAVQERIAAAAARHDAVLEEYGAHLVDFMAALERPALNDPSVAATERFDRARINADDARLTVRHGAQELVAAYHEAVAELEVSWRIAREHAERVGTSYLEPAVSRRLAKAVDLMAVVRGGATEHERALAYQRVRRLVGTSVRVPQVAELAIARLVRPVLTKEGFDAAGGLDALVRASRSEKVVVVAPARGVPFTRHRLEDLT
ncbi:hypothetical protein AB0D98_19745 [Streptomyces sp. NPDC047987]|uniref:hypothetical protein n=1 Tax=unclassified Streptomyces TaxID=2593676 RepID=UPI003428E344